MDRRKVIFFGVTGIEKNQILLGFKEWCNAERYRHCKVFNFEDDYLIPILPREYVTFLDNDLIDQHDRWQKAWSAFQKDVAAYEREHVEHDIFISIHACISRAHFGARTLILPEQIASLGADHVVTLLENVYDMWWRTQYRAAGESHLGTPTLQDILLARQVETIIADQVTLASTSRRVRHLVLGVNHPKITLGNWLYGERPKVIYLCFPISDPRTLLERGDVSGRDEINRFLQKAYELQLTSKEHVFICPLAIDELPLVKACVGKMEGDLAFDREKWHWDLAPVFPQGTTCLSPGAPPGEYRVSIPVEQIRAAAGTIRTDVARRDYRLVDQADYIAAYNPKFREEFGISSGCKREIEHAAYTRGIPVYAYQDPVHDKHNEITKIFSPTPGSMERSQGERRIVWKESLAEVFNRLSGTASYKKQYRGAP